MVLSLSLQATWRYKTCFVKQARTLPSFLSLDLVVHHVVTPLQTLFNFLAPVFFCFTHMAKFYTYETELGQLAVPQSWTWLEKNGDNLADWSHCKHTISISNAHSILPAFLQFPSMSIPENQHIRLFLSLNLQCEPPPFLPLYLILLDLVFEKIKVTTGQFPFLSSTKVTSLPIFIPSLLLFLY